MTSKKSFRLFLLTACFSFSLLAQQPSVPMRPGQVNAATISVSDATKTINYVNSLLSLYNEYDSKLSIDMDRGELVFSDKYSELRGKFNAVEFRRADDIMGLFCKSDSSCLSVYDVDTGDSEDSRVKYTFGLEENDEPVPEMERAIEKLNTMLIGLAGSSSSSSLSSVAGNNLNIINDAFETYNSYGTVFSVKGKTLHWDSEVANVYANLNQLTFYIDYENQWMVMRCTSGECMEGSISKESYSMGLSDDSGIAPNIEAVLQAFNDLRREILTN
jgi:hypothetical protein